MLSCNAIFCFLSYFCRHSYQAFVPMMKHARMTHLSNIFLSILILVVCERFHTLINNKVLYVTAYCFVL